MEGDLIENYNSFSEREVSDKESDSDDEFFEDSFGEESHGLPVSFSIDAYFENEWIGPSQQSVIIFWVSGMINADSDLYRRLLDLLRHDRRRWKEIPFGVLITIRRRLSWCS
jgi:hypothetical protein